VILDEASARLDPATEHLIEQAIDRLLSNRTGIIIAHRLKTVLRADRPDPDEGRIIEETIGRRCRNPQSRFINCCKRVWKRLAKWEYHYLWRMIRYRPWPESGHAVLWATIHIPTDPRLISRAYFDTLTGDAPGH
jgi:hypothetical protein